MSGKCSSQNVGKWSYDINDTKAKIPWIWQGRFHRCQNAFKESFYKNQDSIVIWHWFVLLQYVSCFINDNGTYHTDSLWNFSRSHVARYQKEFVFATFLFFFVLFSVVKRAVCSYSHLILLYPICTIIKRNWKKKRIKIVLEREVIWKALDVNMVLQSLVEIVMPLLQKKIG